jgi:hypothetical protein
MNWLKLLKKLVQSVSALAQNLFPINLKNMSI